MQVYDAHNDFLTYLTTKTKITKYYTNQLKTNEVAKVFAAFFCNPKDEKARNNIELSKKLFGLLSNNFIPTLENIGYVTNLEQLNDIIQMKPFCVSLTWNYDNNLAGGAYGDSGITKWGQTVIKKLEANHIFVDVAHLNRKSFFEFASLTTKPILCTHTASSEIYGIPRNLNAEQIKIIHESKGYIGLCMYNTLLCNGKANFEIIIKHIEKILSNSNENILGLGTDFNSTKEENPIGLKDYNGIQNLLVSIQNKFGNLFCTNFASNNLKSFMEKSQRSNSLRV